VGKFFFEVVGFGFDFFYAFAFGNGLAVLGG